ncbi:hypothetical protein FQR65_LT10850 [Abscondita terminalis]|nr:hypothetical protein FQR65_LT10850 [Abscondita terminalis]
MYRNNSSLECENVPNSEYEKLRRRISNNIEEFWNFIYYEVNGLKNKEKVFEKLISTFDKIISFGVEHKRSLINDVNNLGEVDGYSEWREKEISVLSDIVQKRLSYLQNPVNCKSAKKLLCEINYKCGFGCQIHHLVSCLILAYGIQRTLILRSTKWQYHKEGWSEIFKPISLTCTETYNAKVAKWPGANNVPVISIPTTWNIIPRSNYLPLAVPEDLAYRLETVHGNPFVWWVGQILKYIWKPQDITMSHIKQKFEEIKIQNPYVGIHIRRTDKIGTEAAFHAVEEYMSKVEEYYNQIENNRNIAKRRVYIATDDINAIKEAKKKYSHYEIMYNPDVPKFPKKDFLHKNDNIFTVITDIHILSHSDYLVCTFSSNICRLAYELMQNNYVDAANRSASLDDVYFYIQPNINPRKAILRHKAENEKEIDLLPGDIVDVSINYWNGYSLGTNSRTHKKGLYPSFKVEMATEIVKFPTYAEIESNKLFNNASTTKKLSNN